MIRRINPTASTSGCARLDPREAFLKRLPSRGVSGYKGRFGVPKMTGCAHGVRDHRIEILTGKPKDFQSLGKTEANTARNAYAVLTSIQANESYAASPRYRSRNLVSKRNIVHSSQRLTQPFLHVSETI